MLILYGWFCCAMVITGGQVDLFTNINPQNRFVCLSNIIKVFRKLIYLTEIRTGHWIPSFLITSRIDSYFDQLEKFIFTHIEYFNLAGTKGLYHIRNRVWLNSWKSFRFWGLEPTGKISWQQEYQLLVVADCILN